MCSLHLYAFKSWDFQNTIVCVHPSHTTQQPTTTTSYHRAAFVNKLLAKGGEKLNDAEIEAYMDKARFASSFVCPGFWMRMRGSYISRACAVHLPTYIQICMQVLALFSYLHDKDVYLDAYSATLGA